MTNKLLSNLIMGAAFCLMIGPLNAQTPQLSHFVAPSYPPLARQAALTGQVSFQLRVAKDGHVIELIDERSTEPLLTQAAKALGSRMDVSAKRP